LILLAAEEVAEKYGHPKELAELVCKLLKSFDADRNFGRLIDKIIHFLEEWKNQFDPFLTKQQEDLERNQSIELYLQQEIESQTKYPAKSTSIWVRNDLHKKDLHTDHNYSKFKN
jgi:hypothetical protein